MGPFVPDLISDQMNLLLALLVGVGFGFVLEQAGFSSSRKLTGLFYGTDFTVLRVFFTAGVTAMTGVALLGGLGLLDTSLIYINPTFVSSALVGGVIMGVGFVLGGYCPGTSFCGAAVGRVDAMMFVGGGLVGAFAFGELFPRVQGLYFANSLGDLTLPAVFGVSPGVVALEAALLAIVAFVVTGRIERGVNPASDVCAFPIWRHRLAAGALLASSAFVVMIGRPDQRMMTMVSGPAFRTAHPVRFVTTDEVAFRLLDHDERLVLIDTRRDVDFKAFSLPRALNIPVNDMFAKAAREPLSRPHELKVLFGADDETAVTAALLAIQFGFENVAVLRGGLARFRADYLGAPHALDAFPSPTAETQAFRAEAGPQIAALIKLRGAVSPVRSRIKKVAGGCGV